MGKRRRRTENVGEENQYFKNGVGEEYEKEGNFIHPLNKDSRPTRVFDKISGVFSCTICDALILDKYSFQDHIYPDKHKENMKLVQVIAGPEERLFINRQG